MSKVNNIKYEKLIWTGAADEYVNYKYGKLPYQSLRFKFENHKVEQYQPYAIINYPNEEKFIRIVEFKHATKQKAKTTTIMKEYSKANGVPCYPVKTKPNLSLYNKYLKDIEKLENVYFIGRLAQYKYINMDNIIYDSLKLFRTIMR